MVNGQQFVDAPPLNVPVTKPGQAAAPVAPTQPAKAPETPPSPAKTESVDAPKVTSADILKRSSESAPVKTDAPATESSYREDLEKITDPAIRAIAEKQLKDLESGYNKKFQTLAQQKKDLEQLQSKISTWTPQRLAEELRKPEFVQAMQVLQSQSPPHGWDGSTEEWSALSNTEKQQFQQMRQETQSLQSQMAKMLQSQEDTEIKKLYPDYEPQVVDEAIDGLRTGQITASRADIWKVVNHDKNVEKGYQFGYEDGYKKAIEKLNGNSMSTSNLSVTNADEVPEEVRKGGFSSIAMWRLSRSKNGAKK